MIYYTAIGSKGSDNGPYWAKVYRYTDDLNKEIVMYRSENNFRNISDAIDAASKWCEDNGYHNAELDEP